jgi:5-oxoprolinase (ATP-hydrolysing)
MGVTLQNTSTSVNIKERLDFSCAIFDAEGQLVANAPHIPVHLGSMGESVQSLIRAQGHTLRPGDVYALNNPYNGGTHLPDVTVITPVFLNSKFKIQNSKLTSPTPPTSLTPPTQPPSHPATLLLPTSTSPLADTTLTSAVSPPAPCPPRAAL